MIKFVGNGKWLAIDVYRFFHSINVFYNRLYVFDKHYKDRYGQLLFALQKSLYFINEGDELYIQRIVIASPAEFNLKGCEGILREIREFYKDVTYRNEIEKKQLELGMREKELDLQIKEEELKDKRTQHEIYETRLVKEKIELLKSAGASDEEIHGIIGTLLNPAKKMINVAEKQEIELRDENQ